MKIELPEHIGEITLGQYQRYDKLNKRTDLSKVNYNRRKIDIFTKLNYKQVKNIKQKDVDIILGQIDQALNLAPKFQQRFKIGEVEFGMIPNFDKMSNAEYGDTFLYPVIDQDEEGEVITTFENVHRLMAILCRPITGKDRFGNYKIARYYGTEEHAEYMKQMPMVYVNGILDFFLNLSKELKSYFLKYTREELAKAIKRQSILISGNGTQPS